MFKIGLANSDELEVYLGELKEGKGKAIKETKGWRLFVSNTLYEFITFGPKLIRELMTMIEVRDERITKLEAKIKNIETAQPPSPWLAPIYTMGSPEAKEWAPYQPFITISSGTTDYPNTTYTGSSTNSDGYYWT
jgi:hypothetical protein